MAAFLMCLDCDRWTNQKVADAKGHGWINLFMDAWNDLWRCPWCAEKRR